MSKKIKIGDLFTVKELNACVGLTAEEISVQIVEPKLEHINKQTGQENHAKYWAYVLVHVATQIKEKTND